MTSESLENSIRELREIEERYHLAIAASDAGIWDWNILTDRVYYSSRLKEFLGHSGDAPWDTPDEFWSRLHPDDIEAVRLAVRRHLEERVALDIDCRLRPRSGEHLWFHARGQALWNEAGVATRMSGSLTDISARKRVESDLAKSEGRFRGVMEQSPLAIEILSPDGQIKQVNEAWRRMWGASDEEIEQTLANYSMLSDEQIVALGIMPLVQRAFAGEAVVLPMIQYDANVTAKEFGVEVTDLRAPWIQCHLYPIKNAQGEIVNVVNAYMDITELRRAEQELREQKDVLARVQRTTSMGQLTGSIAHELNQPLTGILSNAQAAEMMIKKGRGDAEELATILGEIVDDAKRAGEVIRNLRELYRGQKGDFQPVDINAVVVDTVRLFRSEFLVRRVAMTMDCAPSAPVVMGNRVQIQQVLVNFIMNAEEAMQSVAPDNRWLRLTTGHESNDVRVWVEDNGPGIEPGRFDRIFEPLVTWKTDGTGMGLAVSNSIIRSHGGRMLAENRSEGGARVGFVLPVSQEGQPA